MAATSGKVGGQGTPVLSRERRKMNQRWSRGRRPLSMCVSMGWEAAYEGRYQQVCTGKTPHNYRTTEMGGCREAVKHGLPG